MPKRIARPTRSTSRDRPTRSTSSATPERAKTPVRTGWSGHKEVKESAGDFPDDFKIEAEAQLIKFLEDEPFASYRQHWIERSGKKSFTCIEESCPLCEIGDRPAMRTCFNVLSLDGKPANKVLTVGVRLGEQLRGFGTDRKTGPLTRLYWSVSKSGKGTKTSYAVVPVKERDLEEDWDMEPLDDAVLEAFEAELYTEEAIQVPSRKQLREIAAEVSDEDVDDEYSDDDD